MSRVVNTNNPGKIRSQLMRTAAELLRHLSQKNIVDSEAKDMAALLVYCLREINDGIEASTLAWEKRDYWVKAERLRQRWMWTGHAAANLEHVIRTEAWDVLPGAMAELFGYFSDIKITKFTRQANTWEGAYERLLRDLDWGEGQ